MTETLRLVISGDPKGGVQALDALDKKATQTFNNAAAAAKKSQGAFGSWSAGMNKAANVAAGGFAIGLGVIAKSVYDFQKNGSQIKSLMRATGMDAEGASTLTGQWERYGVEAGAASMATKTLAKGIDQARNGVAMYADAFNALGLSVGELKQMSDTQAIFATRDALAELGPSLERTRIATLLLGRGSQTMSLWYSQSAEQMAKTNELLKKSGLIWDDKTVEEFDRAAIAQAELKIALTGISETIAEEVVPSITPFVEGLGTVLRYIRPMAPAIVPITLALGGFVAVVKVANALSGAWGQTFGRLIPKMAASVVAEEAETAAITTQTAAIEANTAARVTNAMTAPGGAVPPLLPNAAPATGMGTLATAGAVGVIASSAALTALGIYYGITYKQPGGSPNASTILGTGGHGGIGRAGAASQAAAAEEVRARLDREVEGIARLNEIVDQINRLRPSRDTVGATKVYEQKLKDLATEYPEIAGQVHEAAQKLRDGAQKFEDAAKAAADAADQLSQSIMATSKSVGDYMAQMYAAGQRPTQGQLTQAVDSLPVPKAPKNWQPAAGADNAPVQALLDALTKRKPKLALGGTVRYRPGGTEVVAGEAEDEDFVPASKRRAYARSVLGDRPINFNNCVFSAHSPRELADEIKRELSREVRYASG